MEEFLTVAAVARRLGVAPATLRTWARRYGLGPTHHEAGEHRRYSAGDVAKLTLMRRLITTGVMPVEAAKAAVAHQGQIGLATLVREIRVREELVLALYKAAYALDAEFLEEGIRNEITRSGVITAWQEVIAPLLEMVGDRWAQTGKGIEVEHLLSEIVKRILRKVEVVDPFNARPVLLAAVGDELHSLPIKALTAALAERHVSAYFLGARTPVEALIAMVKKSAPPAIFLWAQMAEHADPKFFRNIPTVRPKPRFILGGPGWATVDIGTLTYAKNLFEACDEIWRAVGGGSHR